ncbi:MAG: ABC transporter ATP-binding protein, partial [Chloroflexi bacterium]|nr:ABC transporter ATP-binding protein [Chloroflexota bacterium]
AASPTRSERGISRLQAQNGQKPLLRVMSFLWEYPTAVSLTIVALVVSSLLHLATPMFIQSVIDRTAVYGSPSVLGLYAMGVVLVSMIGGIFGFGQRYGVALVVQSAIFDLRNALYSHILNMPFGFHDRTRTGQLISRMTSDIDNLIGFLDFGISGIVGMALTFSGATLLLFRMSWQLGLLGMLIVPPLTVTALKGSNTLGPRFLELRRQFARIVSQIQENFAGVRVVKAFAREEYEIERFRAELNEFLRQRMGVIRVFSTFMPFMELLTNLGTLLILGYGGIQVINGQLSLGELVASQAYLMMLAGPIRMIGFMVVMGRRASAAAEHICEILDARREVLEKPDAYELPPVTGEVVFENVSFGYEEGSQVLKNINLTVRPGETIALLGATGSGKTSIVNLIPRFYDVTAGRVLIDGHDVRDVTIKSLRRQIGTIFQEAVLFTGTIAENIAFGKPDATIEEIQRAAEMAQAHGFITEFPDGYQTRVGERGITLSGGQRQRITIARALLLNAAILIMDDSTSSVDVETEYLIQQALTRAMEGRTAFVIAHRLSTVKNADRIIVLDQGQIVQEGTHDELLAVEGPYRRIYETQFADQEKEEAREEAV